ncbi:DNA alkylation repair protein, partial [Nocardioides sp.]|uniref:DNA alkylation repair protein n=1 Tax=Nocardioides sp. TaxID=35761 RepID=UPI002737755B
MTTPAALAELLRAELATHADPARAPGMQAYMRSTIPFHGIGAAPLEQLCRPLLDLHRLPDEAAWRAAVVDLWDHVAHREEWYAALHLAGHRHYRAFQQPRTLELYRHLVVTGAWWDVVDWVASRRVGPILRTHPTEVAPLLRAWSVADDLWLRRTAIISQLGSGADTDTDLLVDVIDANLDGSDRRSPAESPYGREFFIRKA